MKHAIVLLCCAGSLLFARYALAQSSCIVPTPPAPPIPRRLIVDLPSDGGTVGCTIVAVVPGSKADANSYAISNSKCAQSVAIAKQAAAIDNGWDDGGTP